MKQEFADQTHIESGMSANKDGDVQYVLPSRPISDWLLENSPQFLRNDVLDRAYPKQPGWIEVDECGSAYRFVNADIERDSSRDRLACKEPALELGLIAKRKANTDMKGNKCPIGSRRLLLDFPDQQCRFERIGNMLERRRKMGSQCGGIEVKYQLHGINGEIEVGGASVWLPDEIEGVAALEDERALKRLGRGYRAENGVLSESGSRLL